MLLLSLTILSLSVASLAKVPLIDPTFRVTASENGAAPEVHVRFANGVEAAMVLERYDPFEFGTDKLDEMESCVYIGHLEGHEESSSVAVSGCLKSRDDPLRVTLKSPHSKNILFNIDREGNVETLADPFEGAELMDAVVPDSGAESRKFTLEEGDEEVNEAYEKKIQKVDQNCIKNGGCTFPSKMGLRLQLGYDRSLKERLAKDKTTVKKWMADVMGHAQAHFKDPTLYTKVIFDIDKQLLYNNSKFTAEKNLRDVRDMGHNKGTGLVVFFCDDPKEHGVIGMAYVSVLCYGHWACSLNEHRNYGPAATAMVVAHEMGHNFGMKHDADPFHKGHKCRGQMSGTTGWSLCSVYDFLRHYDAGKKEGTCMKILNPKRGPPIPPEDSNLEKPK